MDKPLKAPPPYAVTSVDNALRLATMLQLEDSLTVAQAAEQLGVARSTAHRLLSMLVYRDFARRDESRAYHVGPVLELATASDSDVARLRKVALPHLRHLVDLVDESANVAIRTGDQTRFIASVECSQTLRVSSREGMVFPAERTTAGLLLLSELPSAELEALYLPRSPHFSDDRPGIVQLRGELSRVRRNGFALNRERSERGLVALGVPVRDGHGVIAAGLSISMPSVRYDRQRLPEMVATLRRVARSVEASLNTGDY